MYHIIRLSSLIIIPLPHSELSQQIPKETFINEYMVWLFWDLPLFWVLILAILGNFHVRMLFFSPKDQTYTYIHTYRLEWMHAHSINLNCFYKANQLYCIRIILLNSHYVLLLG